MLSNRPETQNAPWNRGKLVGQKLPPKLRDVFGIRVRLQLQRNTRELALFNLAIDSKLRGCDLIALRVGDLARGGSLGSRAQVIQQKTGRVVQFEVTEQTRHSVYVWIAKRALSRQDFLFPSRVRLGEHLSCRQYARIVKGCIAAVGLPSSDYGTHSMRRTKAMVPSWEGMRRHRRNPDHALLPSNAPLQRQKMNLTPSAPRFDRRFGFVLQFRGISLNSIHNALNFNIIRQYIHIH